MIDQLPVVEREEIVAQLQENDNSEAPTVIDGHGQRWIEVVEMDLGP